jgi:hypothetical protein
VLVSPRRRAAPSAPNHPCPRSGVCCPFHSDSAVAQRPLVSGVCICRPAASTRSGTRSSPSYSIVSKELACHTRSKRNRRQSAYSYWLTNGAATSSSARTAALRSNNSDQSARPNTIQRSSTTCPSSQGSDRGSTHSDDRGLVISVGAADRNIAPHVAWAGTMEP